MVRLDVDYDQVATMCLWVDLMYCRLQYNQVATINIARLYVISTMTKLPLLHMARLDVDYDQVATIYSTYGLT
jgi:hypothetical protein